MSKIFWILPAVVYYVLAILEAWDHNLILIIPTTVAFIIWAGMAIADWKKAKQ